MSKWSQMGSFDESDVIKHAFRAKYGSKYKVKFVSLGFAPEHFYMIRDNVLLVDGEALKKHAAALGEPPYVTVIKAVYPHKPAAGNKRSRDRGDADAAATDKKKKLKRATADEQVEGGGVAGAAGAAGAVGSGDVIRGDDDSAESGGGATPSTSAAAAAAAAAAADEPVLPIIRGKPVPRARLVVGHTYEALQVGLCCDELGIDDGSCTGVLVRVVLQAHNKDGTYKVRMIGVADDAEAIKNVHQLYEVRERSAAEIAADPFCLDFHEERVVEVRLPSDQHGCWRLARIVKGNHTPRRGADTIYLVNVGKYTKAPVGPQYVRSATDLRYEPKLTTVKEPSFKGTRTEYAHNYLSLRW